MKRKLAGLLLAGSLILAGTLIAQQNKQADIELQAAIRTETVSGDIKAAIKEYEAIVSKYGKDRAVAASALLHMADCYRKLGDNESRKIYERIVREYADQGTPATIARDRLGISANAGMRLRQIPIESGTERPSPDGRYLTYTDWATGDLAVRDMIAGTKRTLTGDGDLKNDAGYADEAMVSPDGRLVAYSFFIARYNRAELRLVPFGHTDDGNPKTLHQSDETRYLELDGWTPDSKNILVTRQLADLTSQIAMISVADGSLHPLKSFAWKTLGSAALSPDGRHVAYSAAETDTNWDIFVLAADGSWQGKLTDGPANDSFPLWTPDGSQVLFFSDRTGAAQSVWSVPVREGRASGRAQLVKADFGFGRFGPLGITRDGALYFMTGGGATNVYLAELDPDMKFSIPPDSISQRFVNSTVGGSWSPDGASLVYYTLRAPSQTIPGGTDLVIRTLKTGSERLVRMPQLTVPPYIYTPPPRWFPDNRSVLVLSYAAQHPGFGFYRVDLESGNAELLQTVQDAGPPDLSSDGKAIFYREGNTATGMRLIRFDLQEKRETELKRIRPGQSFTPIAVSPDGKQLAYGIMDNPTGTVAAVTSLEIIPTSGGAARLVMRGKMGSNTLGWSPDQHYLLFAFFGKQGDEKSALWRIPVTGGEPEQIGPSGRPGNFPQIHSNGREILFGTVLFDESSLWVLENFLPKAEK